MRLQFTFRVVLLLFACNLVFALPTPAYADPTMDFINGSTDVKLTTTNGGLTLIPGGCSGYTACYSINTSMLGSTGFTYGSTDSLGPRLAINDGASVTTYLETITGITYKPNTTATTSLTIQMVNQFSGSDLTMTTDYLQYKESGNFFPFVASPSVTTNTLTGSVSDTFSAQTLTNTVHPLAGGSFSDSPTPLAIGACAPPIFACTDTITAAFTATIVGGDTLRLPGSFGAGVGAIVASVDTTVPEPNSLLLLAPGLVLLGLFAWRRRRLAACADEGQCC